MSKVDAPDNARELFLLERNALAALYKNVSDTTLAKALPAALALAVRRATARGDVDPTQLEIGKPDTGSSHRRDPAHDARRACSPSTSSSSCCRRSPARGRSSRPRGCGPTRT